MPQLKWDKEKQRCYDPKEIPVNKYSEEPKPRGRKPKELKEDK